LLYLILLATVGFSQNQTKYKVLIVTGQNNHGWQTSSSIIEQAFNQNEMFEANLSVSPPQGADMSVYQPEFKKYDIILISYQTLRNDIEIFIKREYSYIVLDEAQNIKNYKSLVFKAIKTLQSDFRVSLTGTPIENNTMELWSQMEFLNPGLLKSAENFKKNFTAPIENKKDKAVLEQLKKIIFPFILRRKKEDVAPELPEKSEIDQVVEMTPKQRDRYTDAAALFKEKINQSLAENGIKAASSIILEALTYLRQISVHPEILDHKFPLEESGKWQLLLDKIEDVIIEKHKVLIFSQYVRFLKLLKDELIRRNVSFAYIDGQTRDRQEQVDQFQNDPNKRVFLLSLKAAGVGLNLTAADYVILMDPWWNPAVENQAVDRAHRIGQTKNIFVYRFICANSIEEKIINIQKDKIKLSESILPEDSSLIKELNKNDILKLLTSE
ncbi:MAG: DEAD/DEAH box helicase, partial [Calditrichia bacterium]|nr:DEAD/DEAH box helicase [Calditrichia bacterium]